MEIINLLETKNTDHDQSPALLLAMKRVQELEHTLEDSQELAEECLLLQQQHAVLRELCEKERANSQIFQEEIDALKKTIEENQRHRQQLERVIQFLRERAEGSKLEALTLQKDFHEAHEILVTSTKQLEEEKQARQEFHEETLALQSQFEQLKSQILSGKQQQENFDQTIATLSQSQQDLLYQSEHLKSELAACQQDRDQFETDLLRYKTAFEEKEQNLKLAQQHLAKKIKEASYFSEKYEEARQQITDLQHNLLESQVKVSSLQQGTDLQLDHERRIQEQLKENLHNAEALAKKWEDKYFQLHDKFQEIDSQNRTLKSLEERHMQLMMLFNNMSTFIGTPNSSIMQAPNPDHGGQSMSPPPLNTPDSFRYKQNLFD